MVRARCVRALEANPEHKCSNQSGMLYQSPWCPSIDRGCWGQVCPVQLLVAECIGERRPSETLYVRFSLTVAPRHGFVLDVPHRARIVDNREFKLVIEVFAGGEMAPVVML